MQVGFPDSLRSFLSKKLVSSFRWPIWLHSHHYRLCNQGEAIHLLNELDTGNPISRHLICRWLNLICRWLNLIWLKYTFEFLQCKQCSLVARLACIAVMREPGTHSLFVLKLDKLTSVSQLTSPMWRYTCHWSCCTLCEQWWRSYKSIQGFSRTNYSHIIHSS